MQRKKLNDANLVKQIELDEKKRQHGRHQNLLDHIYNVAGVAIFIFPTIILIGIIFLTIHAIFIGDWDSIRTNVERGVLLFLGYVGALLEKLGIKSKN